jgi:cell division protein FtsA
MSINFPGFKSKPSAPKNPEKQPTPEPEIVVGLDIGTTKICAVVGRRNEHHKVDILGMGSAVSHGVNRGTVANIELTVQSIKQAVAEASEKSGVDIRVVNVGIAGQHIRSHQQRNMMTRQSRETEISKADVNRLLQEMYRVPQQAGYEIIHVLPQDYTVDGEKDITNPVGMSGITLEGMFHVITGSLGAILNIKRCVELAGLQINGLTLEPLASSEAVLSQEEKDAGVVLVDIGGGTTDVAIFYQNIIRHTAVIPLGGNVITQDIREGCSVLFDQAEALKVRFGSAITHESMANEVVSIPGLRGRDPKEISLLTLAHIINARVKEIIQHVQYEIRSSGYEKRLSAGIVLTGGGARLKNIKHLFSLMTGMEACIGDSNGHLGQAPDIIKSPVYATVCGLVLTSLATKEKDEKLNDAQVINSNKPVHTNEEEGVNEPQREGLLNRLLSALPGMFIDPELGPQNRTNRG